VKRFFLVDIYREAVYSIVGKFQRGILKQYVMSNYATELKRNCRALSMPGESAAMYVEAVLTAYDQYKPNFGYG